MEVKIKVKLNDYIKDAEKGVEVEGVYNCFLLEADPTVGFNAVREEETLTVDGVEYVEGENEKAFEERFEMDLRRIFDMAFEAAEKGEDYC